MRPASPPELFIAQKVTALTRTLPAARDGDAHAIHQARVATRRLREALPLIGSEKRVRGVGKVVRRLTRALGPVRELDVALQMLDELSKESGVPAGAVSCLQRVVADERERLHHDLVRRLDRCDLAKLRKKALAAARHASPSAAGETAKRPKGQKRAKASKAGTARTTTGRRIASDPARLEAAERRVGKRAERLRATIDAAAAIYLPDRLHEVRIAVKKLRYALEISKTVSGSRAGANILTLRHAQDLLGRMHDLEVLIARTRAVQASAQVPSLRVSGELDGLVRRLETECRQLHGKYMASRDRLLKLCDRVASVGDRQSRGASAA